MLSDGVCKTSRDRFTRLISSMLRCQPLAQCDEMVAVNSARLGPVLVMPCRWVDSPIIV